eukprot:TRINITY_DN4845_c0_g2_i1.p1 TRINITY_DN4845_c0_g2~~TRINITY_DN4845_c0_g2_i1.p1  ORF type:complete len:190 (+),score=37.44 TRINITY_DN4845_c0_g2_i1:51-620(+)
MCDSDAAQESQTSILTWPEDLCSQEAAVFAGFIKWIDTELNKTNATEITAEQADELANSPKCALFNAGSKPGIPIAAYLERFHTHAQPGLESVVQAACLIKRLIAEDKLKLHSLNVHRVTAVSLLLSSKATRDVYYDNVHISKVAGLPVDKLNLLEVTMFEMLGFELHCPLEQKHDMFNQLLEMSKADS